MVGGGYIISLSVVGTVIFGLSALLGFVVSRVGVKELGRVRKSVHPQALMLDPKPQTQA